MKQVSLNECRFRKKEKRMTKLKQKRGEDDFEKG